MKNGLQNQVRISLNEVWRVCEEALARVGVPEDVRKHVVEALVTAELRGIRSHGLSMLTVYLQRVRCGGIVPHALPEVIKEYGGLVWLDGQGGFGPAAAAEASELAVSLAEKLGVALVIVGNTNHVGALGCYTSKIAFQGYIAFMCSNANPTVAPYGGSEARLGTNPLSFAFPWPSGPGAIIVDLSTSAVAKGKIYQYAARGEPIPEGWALDRSGKPTTDPREAIEGILLPMAGPKGYALAVAVDLLTGVLDGRFFGERVLSLHREMSRPQGVSFALGVLKVTALHQQGVYETLVGQYGEYLREASWGVGRERVYLPGEQELLLEREQRESGLLIDSGVWETILKEVS